ncbi:NF-kappa-B-repressing factor [Ooceraea biroi]|uniref:NF-kappa-B-repressing factor n=1 Tax=Ooceraea biroi TaxID=2015173 RepID=A0A026WZ68_OOCBI|nr:NF-kappa-B-repressing factor [Ooceraea biroi]
MYRTLRNICQTQPIRLTLVKNLLLRNRDMIGKSNKMKYQSCRKLNTEEPPSKRLNTEERPSKRRKINVTSCRDHSYGDIILWERPGDVPQSILNTSANISGANLKWEYGQKQGVWECVIYLNSKRLASCTSFNKKIAKNDTARDALNELRKRYYTIKVKPSTDATSNVTVTTKEIKPEATVHDDERKESNGIGEKMMKMMGWMGGGLGKSEQGVVEPMSTTLEPQVSRKGLGLKSGSCTAHEVKAKCQKLFRDFLRTDMQNDIVFLDFTNDERQVIHQIARTMDLKSRSYGPTDKRKLIVSRKIDARTLLRELKSLGGATEKYELVEPAGNKLTPSSTSTSS